MKALSCRRLFALGFAVLGLSSRAELPHLPQEFQIVLRAAGAEKLRTALAQLNEKDPTTFVAAPLFLSCPSNADFCGARFLQTELFSLRTQILPGQRVELTIRIENSAAMKMFQDFLSSRQLVAQRILSNDGDRLAVDFSVGPMQLHCEAPEIEPGRIGPHGAHCALSTESPKDSIESNFIVN